jgi:hypothetical protein
MTNKFRVEEFRHNPYVGSFPYAVENPQNSSLLMNDNELKKNPMIGLFRHSPPIHGNKVGFKALIYEDSKKTPVLSQLRICRPKTYSLPTNKIIQSLHQIPISVYNASSVGSPPAASASEGIEQNKDSDVPVCSICLEPYADGDEILTLACSHCFHSDCVNKWFVRGCFNTDVKDAFRCPECRQDHVALSEAGSHSSAELGISSKSFLQIGQSLFRNGGYDFSSDIGSEHSSTVITGAAQLQRPTFTTPSPDPSKIKETVQAMQRNQSSFAIKNSNSIEEPPKDSHQPNRELEWSIFSDCGYPLDK